MYAIVEIAGKQFRVAKDMKIKVPVIQMDAGKNVDFDRVFMIEDDKGDITLGKPLVKNTSVSAKIIEHDREKKIIVFKKKRRKGYQKKNGHRQGFSMIEITGIGAAKKVKETKAVAEVPKKAKVVTTKSAAGAGTKSTQKAATTKATIIEKKPATATKPAKKAPAKKTTTTKAATTKKKPAAKATTAKKTPVKKVTKTASSAPKKDVKED